MKAPHDRAVRRRTSMRRAVTARAAAALFLSLAVALPARAESPRWGSFEIAAGMYRPDIDSEFSFSPGPYERIYGTDRGWMFRLGLARKIFDRWGSLEAGLRTGYFQASGHGVQEVPPELPTDPPTFKESGDWTKLRIIPTSAFLTYRFDWAAERYPVPIAPYARVALERYNWWVTDGAGHSSRNGATNGWSAAGGVALLLDIFDRGRARELDQDSGINHTYAFAELEKKWIDDFGASDSWDLSDERLSFSFGLMFVF